uniref:NAD binding site:D-amino acid oxidase n=1 Tax=Paulinella chromatophora TaxID=39717 RepID=B1X4G5_PAUCH|nr:NAD binding site:D-amino acid oxidase [Paulinella chromatophora]ACB42834.1 NAD binding site:D-amino acid oxidase [Paulinella chromatophora]
MAKNPKLVIIVGAGIVGISLAWHLQNLGHEVKLVDPKLYQLEINECASFAATGILMGNIFNPTKGRSWQLRQKSITLWTQWRNSLKFRQQQLIYRPGLLFLSTNKQDQNSQFKAAHSRTELSLSFWNRSMLNRLSPTIPETVLAGLFSPEDGQIDPNHILNAFYKDSLKRGLEIIPEMLIALKRQNNEWRLEIERTHRLKAPWVVLCAGFGLNSIFRRLGYDSVVESIIGQALQLELPHYSENNKWQNWPGSLMWRENSLTPINKNTFWIGSTLESSNYPEIGILGTLINRYTTSPLWLKKSKIIKHWQGRRYRPIYKSAPLLQLLAPGLIVANAHYRNGMLLAPATAEWVQKCITLTSQKEIPLNKV